MTRIRAVRCHAISEDIAPSGSTNWICRILVPAKCKCA